MADEVKKEAEPQQPAQPPKEEAKKPEIQPPTPEDIIKEKELKIAELNDKYLRSLAELENFRKRVSRDKEDFVKYARGESVCAFLPVVDNFERAVAAADKTKDYEGLKKGIDMVLKQFENALHGMHVKEIPSNIPFDPEKHHAVHKEHRSDKKDGEILEVYQKGYMLDDKVVRPAMVKVAVYDKNAAKPEDKKQGG